MDLFSESQQSQLYKSLKPMLWILQIDVKTPNGCETNVGTAVSVSSDGFLLTCANHFYDKVEMISARRLNEKKNYRTATIRFIRPEWDLALLKVDILGCDFGEFESNGALSVGQPLLHIGHPNSFFVGSYLVGHVCFPCTEEVILPSTYQTCDSYHSTDRKGTPRYRIMGHVWNESYFGMNADIEFTYEETLHPLVPIIQCSGLNAKEGCWGGPLFNINGKIVGILSSDFNGFEIAIHVTIIRKFLNEAFNQTPSGSGSEASEASEAGSSSKNDKGKKKRTR